MVYRYVHVPQAIEAAISADAIILVMGIRSCAYDNQCWIGRAEIEGEEKDRVALDLPGYQPDLIRAVRSAAGQKKSYSRFGQWRSSHP